MKTENTLAKYDYTNFEDCIFEEESSEPIIDQNESKVTELALVPVNDSVIEDEPQADDSIKTIEGIIENLPGNFPSALPIIQKELAPLLIKCEPAIVEHFIPLIKKKTNASGIKAIKVEISNAKERMELIEAGEIVDGEIDPEVLEIVEQIKNDPLLFRKRMDLVAEMGVIEERQAIGLNFVVFDSRLIPMGSSSEALGLKHSGTYGSGKSYPMLLCKDLYPSSAYHFITAGSSKSLYHGSDSFSLKHKALIVAEALILQSDQSGADSELAYAIRSLLSEGQLSYQTTGYVDKKKQTVVSKTEGPTSLLTTTIQRKLERQLEDRLITIHPDESSAQSKKIIERSAEDASGEKPVVDQKIIQAMKVFHNSLEPIHTIIPFAKELSNCLRLNDVVPVSARRSFKRILSAIKSVAICYQFQREKDEFGRLIAEMSDYFIVFQLMRYAFLESLGESFHNRDKRMEVIETEGPITSRKLLDILNISGAALSQWIKPKIKNGQLKWVDKNGSEFTDEASLKTAKYSGTAYIKLSNPLGLPSPFEITGDPLWDKDGELYRKYDLMIDSNFANDFSIEEELDIEEDGESIDLSDIQLIDNSEDRFKVLRSNMENEKNTIEINEEDQIPFDADEFTKQITDMFVQNV